MTEPIQPQTPIVDDNIVDLPPIEFGPDHTKTADTDTSKPSKERKPPFNLGANKKTRSGVRALVEKDKDKIVTLYVTVGMALMPFKPKTAQAFAQVADEAADAWYNLARENDSVRRTILMLIEGGAWGALFAAHIPIILTMLPENAMASLPFPINPEDFQGNVSDDSDDK